MLRVIRDNTQKPFIFEFDLFKFLCVLLFIWLIVDPHHSRGFKLSLFHDKPRGEGDMSFTLLSQIDPNRPSSHSALVQNPN